jgi:hypothetical protein
LPGRAGRFGRAWYLGAAGAACAVLAAVLIVAFSSGGGRSPQDTTPTDSQIALPTSGPQQQAPGTPRVSATRVAGGRVRFRWTYDARAAGDSFRWRAAGGSASGISERPVLVLSLRADTSLCIQVQVYRSTGSFASSWSDPACIG